MPRPRKRAAAPPAQTNAQEAVAAIIQRALQQGPQHSAAKRVKTSHNNTSSSRSNANPQKPKFDSTQCISWFRKYTDPSDPNVLGPEGMERFCADLKVDPEDIVLLIIAWKMNAKNMGYFTQSEWLRGLGDSDVESDSIEKLQKKFTYFYSLLNDPQTFKSIFRYVSECLKIADDIEIVRVKTLNVNFVANFLIAHMYVALFLGLRLCTGQRPAQHGH